MLAEHKYNTTECMLARKWNLILRLFKCQRSPSPRLSSFERVLQSLWYLEVKEPKCVYNYVQSGYLDDNQRWMPSMNDE